ncbi:MAG: hypothetical protein WC955_03825 [Elusimicrobiota bacterium]
MKTKSHNAVVRENRGVLFLFELNFLSTQVSNIMSGYEKELKRIRLI